MLKRTKNITIVGAGNIGIAMCVDISQKEDYKVTLFSTGGKEFFCQPFVTKGVVIAGTDRAPYVARLKDKNIVYAFEKKSIRVGKIGNISDTALCNIVESLFNIKCSCVPNYLTITFTPSNPILHTSHLYSVFKDSDFNSKYDRMIKFYAEWTDEASELLFRMDEELMSLCNEISAIDLSEVIPNSIHYELDTLCALTKKIKSIPSFQNLDSPMKNVNGIYYIDSESRYFKEDFLYGLCILTAFAEFANVKTPCMDKVLRWYEKISNEEFWDRAGAFSGKSLKELGIPQNFGINKISMLSKFY